jgi:hypothetical protein
MTQGYSKTGDSTTPTLSNAHRRMLFEESGISPEVVAERGVRTVSGGRGELPAVFSWRQKRRGGGVLFTVHRPGGETSWVFRPDKPNPEDPGHKYELPSKHYGGPGNILDVHPRMRPLLDELSVPLVFVEGIKKADAVTSRGAVAVGISGVWNWLSEGEPISDMWEIPVEGRRVYVCFDSDMLRNPNVQMGAERLAEHLSGRGAEVWIVYLPDQPDGSKTGADDFLAGEGTLEELLGLARPFDPEDLQREKLSRNELLRRALDHLMRHEDEMPAKSRRDCSKRAAWRACLTLAERRGELVEDGIEVRIPALTGAELAAMSQPTFSACMRDLAEDGYIRRIEREHSEQALSYVLLVSRGVLLSKNGGSGGAGEKGEGGQGSDGPHHGYKVIPPLPELRWSSPGRKARRGVVQGTRRVRQGRSLMEDVPSIRRPGKKRLEILRYLIESGGSASRAELLERFGGPKTTWRDFKRQALADLLGRRRQYQGQPLTVGPPIIELDGDGVHLVENWQEALAEHRALGEEEAAAIRQKVDHLRQRAAYRKRNETKANRAPTEEEMAEGREERQKRRRVAQLVAQGMARHVAVAEVFYVPDPLADGYIEELRPTGDTDPPAAPPEDHSLDCECVDCSATMPTYARLTPQRE